MTAILDLSQSGQNPSDLADGLTTRLAAMLSVEPENLVLASSPDDARRAVLAGGLCLDRDLTALGTIGLDEVDLNQLNLVRLGDLNAPISLLVSNTVHLYPVRLQLSVPADVLIRAGLEALKPAAREAARAEKAARTEQLTAIADYLEKNQSIPVEIDQDGLVFKTSDPAPLQALGLQTAGDEDERWAYIPDLKTAKSLADHLGLRPSRRVANIRRSTKETDIALTVNLDGEGANVNTGVHFFDHMLDQIARHGGIGLDVVCEGDIEVDTHHTIEDVCLALGEGLRQALGDKRGIARFGFETPMDETRASVWIDLSGRPFAKFEGDIPGERVGDFPVEMCEHAFRSLSETMKAAIHVKVEGENAHHMIESCFKSFGRALRMAARIEGDALPSTKGVL